MYPLDNRTGPDRHRTASDGYDFNDRDGVMMWEETGLEPEPDHEHQGMADKPPDRE
jgi:hypothetical protein